MDDGRFCNRFELSKWTIWECIEYTSHGSTQADIWRSADGDTVEETEMTDDN